MFCPWSIHSFEGADLWLVHESPHHRVFVSPAIRQNVILISELGMNMGKNTNKLRGLLSTRT